MHGLTATDHMLGLDFESTSRPESENYPALRWHDIEPAVIGYANHVTNSVATDGRCDAVGDWRSGDIKTNLRREFVDVWRSGDAV